MFSLKGVIFFLCLNYLCLCTDFEIPKVTLEAFQPSGFQASIPATSGIEVFGFHGKINKPITQIETGEFSGDTRTSTNGYFTYYNPNVNLTKDDTVHYWIYVQHNQLGYRKDAQTWKVGDLRLQPGTGCPASSTKVSDKTKVCVDSVVFEDNFDKGLDENKWILEQYIPDAPDFEFVIYKKDSDVAFIKNRKFCVKPKIADNDDELKKNIDLSDGCTKEEGSKYCARKLFILQNPIVSGRITSKLTFSYGKFEVKARLPSGDWIFPEVYLEDENSRRILIAYARGNAKLTGNDGKDIGGSLLFGGPAAKQQEPGRSSKLSSHKLTTGLLSDSFHSYTLLWKPNQIDLFVDEANYGSVTTDPGFTGENPGKFRLVFGIGVGGVSDFPDNFKSGSNAKPWINKNRAQVKQFYNDKNLWYPTWEEENRQLQIEYVKVTAV